MKTTIRWKRAQEKWRREEKKKKKKKPKGKKMMKTKKEEEEEMEAWKIRCHIILIVTGGESI